MNQVDTNSNEPKRIKRQFESVQQKQSNINRMEAIKKNVQFLIDEIEDQLLAEKEGNEQFI